MGLKLNADKPYTDIVNQTSGFRVLLEVIKVWVALTVIPDKFPTVPNTAPAQKCDHLMSMALVIRPWRRFEAFRGAVMAEILRYQAHCFHSSHD